MLPHIAQVMLGQRSDANWTSLRSVPLLSDPGIGGAGAGAGVHLVFQTRIVLPGNCGAPFEA